MIDYLENWIADTDVEIEDRGLTHKVKFVVNNSLLKKASEKVAKRKEDSCFPRNYNLNFISSIEINSNDISYLIEYCFGCDITEEKRVLNTFLKYDCDNFDYLFSHSNSELELTDHSTFDGGHLLRENKTMVRSENSCMVSCVTGRRNGRIEFKCADGETFDIVMVFSVKDKSPVDCKFKLSVENDSNIFKIDGNDSQVYFPERWIHSDIMERVTSMACNYYYIWNLFDKSFTKTGIEDDKSSAEEALSKYPSEFITVLISKDLREIIDGSYDFDTNTSSYLDLIIDMCIILRVNTIHRFRFSIDDMFRFKMKGNQKDKKKRVYNSLPPVPYDNSSNQLIGRACTSYIGKVTLNGNN